MTDSKKVDEPSRSTATKRRVAPSLDDEPIPRLPRGKLFKLTGPQMFRILFFAALLVGVLALRQPCSEGIGRFVESFDESDAGPTGPQDGSPQRPGSLAGSPAGASSGSEPGQVPDNPSGSVNGFFRITGDMSDEEIRATLRKAGVQVDDAGPDDGGSSPSGP